MKTAEKELKREKWQTGIIAIGFIIGTIMFSILVLEHVVVGESGALITSLIGLLLGTTFFTGSFIAYTEALNFIRKEREGRL